MGNTNSICGYTRTRGLVPNYTARRQRHMYVQGRLGGMASESREVGSRTSDLLIASLTS